MKVKELIELIEDYPSADIVFIDYENRECDITIAKIVRSKEVEWAVTTIEITSD